MQKTVHYQINHMTCQQCVSTVESALRPLADQVKVTLNPPMATLINPLVTLKEINQTLAKAGKYQAKRETSPAPNDPTASDDPASASWLTTYRPLLIILIYILGVTLAIEVMQRSFELDRWMMHFMASFFLVFSFFKMLNLGAFANSYAMYDLLAMRFKTYGLIYPFIELALGIAYLLAFEPQITNIITVVVMGFSSLGVIRAVMNKQKIRCACLGTVFELPMSTITIIEDLLMTGMATWMLV